MSDKDMARRTTAEFVFAGTNITKSMAPYFLSATYTDNEEGETDDLQIKLQDRDGIWVEKWLQEIIDAAASSVPSGTQSETSPTVYQVTPEIGLNVRTGPSTSYSKLGALVCGTEIKVSSMENGWATIDYGGETAYVCADYIRQIGAAESAAGTSLPPSGFHIQAVFARQNWKGDGKDTVLDCGQFEVDSVEASGPPSAITIKATSLPFTAQIRQTKKSKAWESYHLSGIAKEMATSSGMACMYLSKTDPYYGRVEQFQTPDISFLSTLCRNAGLSLKATNNILVLFDQAAYEEKSTVRTITRGDRSYNQYKLRAGTADTKYASCCVSYTDPSSGKCISGLATVEDYKEDRKDNQQLNITAKVSSVAEAQALAGKLLRLHNKLAKTATFTLPGDPSLVAGLTVGLSAWGTWDGKYIITQAKHTVSSNGYTVQIKLRQVLEGY